MKVTRRKPIEFIEVPLEGLARQNDIANLKLDIANIRTELANAKIDVIDRIDKTKGDLADRIDKIGTKIGWCTGIISAVIALIGIIITIKH